MKKYAAILLVVIVAASVLSTVGAVTACPSKSGGGKCADPILVLGCGMISNIVDSPNRDPKNLPQFGDTVQVSVKVAPQLIITRTQQVIEVTILYNKNNFDPLMYPYTDYTFGRKGTEAHAIAQCTRDVNYDGYKDLTLVYNLKDTGFTKQDRIGKLTAQVPNWVCNCPNVIPKDPKGGEIGPINPPSCPKSAVYVFWVTGTVNVRLL